MSPENVQVSRRAGALAAAMNARRVQRARLRAAYFTRWRATTLAAAVLRGGRGGRGGRQPSGLEFFYVFSNSK